MILTRKIQLLPVGDKAEFNRVYKYLRDGMIAQNKAKNQYLSALYMTTMQEVTAEDRKELNHLYSRISTSRKGSAYNKEEVQFPVGLPTASSLAFYVRKDFATACKDGLMYGKISLPTYRKDNPLLVHNAYVKLRRNNKKDNGLYHNYESHMDFLNHLYAKDLEIFIKFANNITFQLYLGQPHKSGGLRSELQQVFEENYKIGDSSIEINKKNQIILNLSMEIPEQKVELDEDVVVGVDLGLAIPAVCTLNNNDYIRQSIGSKDDFLRVRTQLQAQRKRLQENLRYTSGGHGRAKKMKALNRLTERERNFAKTYNHQISKEIVDFAKKNKAKYINLENLKGYNTSQFILRNWSFYELQQFIEYKAAKYGIEVRKVNPCFTSQVCSCCGHWEEGQRIDQAHFVCKECGAELNADRNASRNIAKSTLWGTEKIEKIDIVNAKEYYGIPLTDEDNEIKRKAEENAKRK